jgi:flagellar hook-associated protein 2
MGRIQSNIGLVTGMEIGDTVDKLMELASKSRDLLASRNEEIQQEQVAVTELSALLMSVRYVTKNLGKTAVFERQVATSSNEAALNATLTGSATEGFYQFTPVRTAQHQQLLSAGFKSESEALSAGTLTFRHGDHLQRSLDLSQLNGGAGFSRGSFRITDRSGATAEIDLSTAQTLDDVLRAINTNTQINVTATVDGDRLKLTDNTGQTVSNLKVQEIRGSQTAASLGLAGIDAASATADGQDVVRLTDQTELATLNDGRGVRMIAGLAEIQYTLRDGTTGNIDFSPLTGTDSSTAEKETTLGEVVQRINETQPGKLKAEIAPDGDRLVLTDLTTGEQQFKLESMFGAETLQDLGLDQASEDGVITGRRLVGGLQTVLLSGLQGGDGLGTLGGLQITDRNGQTATVDLSGAETVDDVIRQINDAARPVSEGGAGLGVTARVNQARNGIELVDTTGATAHNLTVASADATGTAEKLGLAVDEADSSVNSGDLHLQTVSWNGRLSDLNGGRGVARGRFVITNSQGQQTFISLTDSKIQTVGDVVLAINRLSSGVVAEINENGDGIKLTDTAGGTGKLKVTDQSGSSAADLHLTGDSKTIDVYGQTRQVVDGSTTMTVAVAKGDTLTTLRDKINRLQGGATASLFYDGSDKPYHLTMTSDQTGRKGELVVDASQLGFALEETVAGQDALMTFGSGGSKSLLASSTNTFTSALPGVKLEIKQASTTPVTVEIAGSDADMTASVKTMVDNYNKLRKRLTELTRYDTTTNKSATLTGDATALRMDSDLNRLLSSRFSGAGSVRSLGELGISFNDDGTLALDETKLKAKYEADPEGVKSFFTKEEVGFSAKFDDLAEQLVGQDVSLMAQRFRSLQAKVDHNQTKLDEMDARLEKQRERMLLSFYNMELAIGKMQSNVSVLNNLTSWSGTTSSSSSSSSSD